VIRRDSFTLLRDTLRWRVALVLGALVIALMVVLGVTNTRLGLPDTAMLAWGVLAIAALAVGGLLVLPRHLGGTIFFSAIALLLVTVMAAGAWLGRPMQHWAYILPPVLIFLLRAGPALAGMILFGAYASACLYPLVPGIEVIRFASGYGLLVCFMYTYALLQERAAAMLRYHSDHDALSNCLNRRTFNEAIDQLAHARSGEQRCTFLLVDIDHFKAINDHHGHLVGDRIITQVAAALGRELDPGMPLFRYGGEEFAVLMAGASLEQGLALAETLRAAVAAADFQGVRVTVSIGAAEWRRAHDSVPAALAQADRALYAAKRGGRNRVLGEPRLADAAA
jgi:diguanylate cyclase (GGDEF)-like protein